MRKIIFILIVFLFIASPAFCKTSKLSWDANKETDISGYKVYMSNKAGSHIKGQFLKEVPLVFDKINGTIITHPTSVIIEIVTEGTYYFVLTAYDKCGNESSFSEEVSLLWDDTAPVKPTGLKAIWNIVIGWIKNLFGLKSQWVA